MDRVNKPERRNPDFLTDEELLHAYRVAFKASKKSIVKATSELQDLFVTRDLAELKTFTPAERKVITDVGDKVMEKCLDELLRMDNLTKFNKFVRVLFKKYPEFAVQAFPFVESLPPSLCPPYAAYEGRVKAGAPGNKIGHALVIVRETSDFDLLAKSFSGHNCVEKTYPETAPIYGKSNAYMLQKIDDKKIFVRVLQLWRLDDLETAVKFYPARIIIMCTSCLDNRLPYMGSDGKMMCSGDCMLMEKMASVRGELRSHFRTPELRLWNLLEIDYQLASIYSSEWTVVGGSQPVTVVQERAELNEPLPLLCPFSRAPPTHPRLHFLSDLPPVAEVTRKWLTHFYSVVPQKAVFLDKQSVFFSLVFLKSNSQDKHLRTMPTLLQQIIRFFFEASKSD